MVKEKPDMYLDEMVNKMIKRTGKKVSIIIIWHSLKYYRIIHKKVYLIINLNF